MDRLFSYKVSKETAALNERRWELVTDLYRTSHPSAAECKHSSQAYELSKNVLRYKTSSNTLKKTEILSKVSFLIRWCIKLSTMWYETKKKAGKSQMCGKWQCATKQYANDNYEVNTEIKGEIKILKMKIRHATIHGCRERITKREFKAIQSYLKKQGQSQINNRTLTPKGTRKE